jgi:acyl carrier protein
MEHHMQMTEFLTSVSRLFDKEDVTLAPDSRLADFGWSSLSVVSFMAFADEELNVTLSPPALAGCETVSDLVSLLGDKIEQP